MCLFRSRRNLPERNMSSRRGQSYTEYIVIVFFGILVLTQGNPSPISRLISAMKNWYQGYYYAMSKSAPQPDWIKK